MSVEKADKLQLFWDHFFRAETGTYEKSTWLDLFLAEFLIRIHDGAEPKKLINFCPISGVVSLVGCELLCGIHRVTSAINAHYTPLPLTAALSSSGDVEQKEVAADDKHDDAGASKVSGLFSKANAQSSVEILRKYLLSGVAWRCLVLLKVLGVEGVSCCRQLSSVLQWVCGEVGGGGGEVTPPNPYLPPPTPAHNITDMLSSRIWSKQKQGLNAKTPLTLETGSTPSRKRNTQTKNEIPDSNKRGGTKDDDSSDSQVSASATDLNVLNKSISIKVQPNDDFVYFDSLVRTPEDTTSFYSDHSTPKKTKPKPDDYTTEIHKEIINSEISPFEFTIIIIDLLKELCKAESSLSGSEGSQISVQCINFSLRNLCSLQFGSTPTSSKSYTAKELSKIKVALTELLIVSLDKVLVRVDLCAKLITNGILPMLLRLLEDIVYKFKFNKNVDNDLEKRDKEEAEELLRYVFGIAYSIIAFFHCLLMQCRSVEKLKEFTEQFKLYGDCLKGGCLRECIEVMVRIPHVQSEGVVLVKRLIEVLGKLVWCMKVCRSEVIHSAACGRNRHKACRARVRAGLHHHHDILGESSLTPSTSSPCSISILLNTLCFLLTDEELSSHNTLRVKILRVFLNSGVCCCFSPAVLMENIVRSMLTHPSTASLCLRVLEHTVYGELGASVLIQKITEDRLPCQVCQPEDVYLRDFKKAYGGSERKNFCSFLIHYNSLLQLDNHSSVLHATVSHIHRVTPKCRSEVMYELLFSVMYPTFIVAKHRYIIRMEEAAYFLTASCLDIFANLLNTVVFAEQFIQKGGLSYVLELVSLNEFSKQCCAILEIAIIVEIHKVTKECPDLSYYQDLSSLSSVQMLLDSLTLATEKCIDVFRVRMTEKVFEKLNDVSREIEELDLPSLGFERSRSVSSPVNIKRDSEKYAEETVEGFLEILSRCGRVWRAAAWVALCSPGFRRLAASALLPSSFRLLKLLLGCWSLPGDRLAAREFAPLEAVLTIHAACDDVTNGYSKAISCRIIQEAIENCPLVLSVKDSDLDNDWVDDYNVNNVQSKEKHVQNEENHVKSEVNHKSEGKSSAKVVVNDESQCNALRVICETLIKVSMRTASTTEVLPPRSPTKALSTLGTETASSGSESGASRSSSESAPEPYASELSDSLTRTRDGYEADIEMGRLEQVSTSRSRQTSAASTPVHYPSLHSGLRSANWSASDGAAHPEYCAQALTLLAALIRRALRSGMEPWGNLAMRLCNRFPTAPLVGSLLYSVRPLFIVKDDTFLELQRCVLELFHRLASWRLEAVDLRAFLRLFLHDRVAPRPLLAALQRLAAASPRYRPDTALEFPLSMHNNEGSPPENPTVNKNSQAEIVVRRYREQHLQAGVCSSWSRHAAVGALGAGGAGGAGWAPWLQGFALQLAVSRHAAAVNSSQDDWSDLEPKTPESPRKKLGSKRVIEDSEREWSHVVSVGHEALMFEIWIQASSGTLSLRLTRPEAIKPLSSATVDIGCGTSIAAQLSELHNKRKLYIQATIYVDGCQMETVLLPLPGILVRKASASLVLLGDTISCNQSSIPDQWQLVSCSIYRGLALTTAAVLHRAAIGPSAPPHLNCLVDKPIPNFGAVMTPDLLESNIDWDQLFESSERAAIQMDEKLIWHYTAHHPYRAFFYTNSTPFGCAVPERAPVRWRSGPRARCALSAPSALHRLGGPEVLTGLAARVCKLTAGQGDVEQGLALSTLLTICDKDNRLFSELYSRPLPHFPHSVYTLHALMSAACNIPPMSLSGDCATLTRADSVLLIPELLEPHSSYLNTTVCYRIEGVRGGSQTCSLWFLWVLVVESVLSNARAAINIARLQPHHTERLLMAIKERFLVWEGPEASVEESEAIVSLVAALLRASSPTPPHATLLELLLLLLKASDAYITSARETMYFLLTPELPENEEFSILNFMGKKSTRKSKRRHIMPVTFVNSTPSYPVSMTSSVTSEDLFIDNTTSQELTDSTKEMKGMINTQIKERRLQNNSTTSMSESSDAHLQESSSTGESLKEGGGERGEGAEGREGAERGEGAEVEALGEYIVVGDDEVRAAAELHEHLYEESRLRSDAAAGWTAIEGLAKLLYDIISQSTLEQWLSESELEMVLVAAGHASCSARAALVRCVRVAERRRPSAHAAPRRLLHLANQISQHECSAELAEACVSLITQCDVPLEDQLHEEIWHDVSVSDMAMCPPLLAILPQTLHNPALTQHLMDIVSRIITKAPLKALWSWCVGEALCRAGVAGVAGAARGERLAAPPLAQLVSALMLHPHSQQSAHEIHEMLSFVEQASPEARVSSRIIQSHLFLATFDCLQRVALQPDHDNYFATVVPGSVSANLGAECIGRSEARSRYRSTLSRALAFLLPSTTPGPDELQLFERLLDALLDAADSGGGGSSSTQLGEALSWALRSPHGALPLRTLTRLAHRGTYPALPHDPATIEKVCTYVMWCVGAWHGSGAAPLGVRDWARGWAVSLPARRPPAALAPARAGPLAHHDAQRWARTRLAAPDTHRCIFRNSALASTLRAEAAEMSAHVSRAQDAARRGFLHALHAQHARHAHAAQCGARVLADAQEELGVWHDPRSYPVSWWAGMKVGAARVRLQRQHLRIDKRFLQPQHQYKADLASRSPPLQCGCGVHSGVHTARGGAGGRPVHVTRCLAVLLHHAHQGDLLLTDRGIHFAPDEGEDEATKTSEGEEDSGLSRRKRGPVFDTMQPMTWLFEDITCVVTRRWCLEERALEVVSRGGAALLVLPSEADRAATRQHLPSFRNDEEYLTESLNLWRQESISNWEYLMRLNDLGGRSYCDLMQYPVMPFIIAEHGARVLDLADPASYRNLHKPIGIQNEAREQHYINTYNDLMAAAAGGAPGPHHYASLYSNSGAVLHYLLRVPPYTQLFLNYQDNNFDIPDRTFHSLATTWRLVTQDSPTDVKELIPEFFYLPEMFYNNEGLELGVRQCGARVEGVELPAWAADARIFTLVLRQALESAYVTAHLPAWIDLVFGCKQTGPQALKAINVFPACTYYGFRPSELEDSVSVSAAESMVRMYGQAPRILFHTRHPLSQRDLHMESTRADVYGGARGLAWGQYAGSPGAGAVALLARRRAPHPLAALQPAPAPPAHPAYHAPVALPPRAALLQLHNESGKSSYALLSWAAGDAVRLHTKNDVKLLMHTVHASDQIRCAASWCGGTALGSAGGVVHVVAARRGGDGTASARHGAVTTRHVLVGAAPLVALCVSAPHAALLAAAAPGHLVLWDLHELSYIRTIPNYKMLPVTHAALSETLGDVASVHELSATSATAAKDYYNTHKSGYPQSRYGGSGDADSFDADSYEADREKYASLVRVHTINGRFVGSVKVAETVTCIIYSHAEEGRSVNCIVAGLSTGGIRLYSSWDLRPAAYIPPASTQPIISLCYSRSLETLWGVEAQGGALCWGAPGGGKKLNTHLLTHAQIL